MEKLESWEHKIIRHLVELGVSPKSIMDNANMNYKQYINSLQRFDYKLKYDQFKKLLYYYCFIHNCKTNQTNGVKHGKAQLDARSRKRQRTSISYWKDLA